MHLYHVDLYLGTDILQQDNLLGASADILQGYLLPRFTDDVTDRAAFKFIIYKRDRHR